jgi:hypothetical protein
MTIVQLVKFSKPKSLLRITLLQKTCIAQIAELWLANIIKLNDSFLKRALDCGCLAGAQILEDLFVYN